MREIASRHAGAWFRETARILCRLLPCLAIAAAVPAAAAAESPETIIKPGEIAEFRAPFSAELREFVRDGKKRRTRTDDMAEISGAVAVPANFSPDRIWPILIVSATANPGYTSSRRLLKRFAPPALAAGWIAIAADPDRDVSARDDTDRLRYALILAALQRLKQECPALPTWPHAFGGFSGGAKLSASLAGFSAVSGSQPIGVFQVGCNEPTMRRVFEAGHLPAPRFLAIPVYLSSGTDDRIATREDMEAVRASLSHAGFRHVRLERFPGVHEVHAAHIQQALEWFLEIARAGN